MKYALIFLLSIVCQVSNAQDVIREFSASSPLAAYSAEWKNFEYRACNTAANASYMSVKEKEIIYILNLARFNPPLFANSVLTRYTDSPGKGHLVNDQYYYQSLIKTMSTLARLPLLSADEKCFESAACHAEASGESGETGHTRKTDECKTKQHFLGECCHYGNAEPLDIVLTLLIDEGIPSLAHRKILLGNYTQVGISIKPHKIYRQNTVLDFYK
jgi:hypothetical protein